jgi:glycosyltransferase involved in cell wall biosynthesis
MNYTEKRNIKVSIITPNYNCGCFIEQAIVSVIAQTYQDWEMIIVDDCSTDDSYTIAMEYANRDGRIKVYRTEHQSGSPVEPRNIGIQKATGRYIAFLDSDDMWLPNKLENQLKLFDNKDTAVVFSNYKKINED